MFHIYTPDLYRVSHLHTGPCWSTSGCHRKRQTSLSGGPLSSPVLSSPFRSSLPPPISLLFRNFSHHLFVAPFLFSSIIFSPPLHSLSLLSPLLSSHIHHPVLSLSRLQLPVSPLVKDTLFSWWGHSKKDKREGGSERKSERKTERDSLEYSSNETWGTLKTILNYHA